jgi:hypothetical protein
MGSGHKNRCQNTDQDRPQNNRNRNRQLLSPARSAHVRNQHHLQGHNKTGKQDLPRQHMLGRQKKQQTDTAFGHEVFDYRAAIARTRQICRKLFQKHVSRSPDAQITFPTLDMVQVKNKVPQTL